MWKECSESRSIELAKMTFPEARLIDVGVAVGWRLGVGGSSFP